MQLVLKMTVSAALFGFTYNVEYDHSKISLKFFKYMIHLNTNLYLQYL